MRKSYVVLVGVLLMTMCLPMFTQASITRRPDYMITAVSVVLPEPKPGQATYDCVPTTANTDIEFVTVWYDSNGRELSGSERFANGETYLARLYVRIKLGSRYYFSTDVVVTVNQALPVALSSRTNDVLVLNTSYYPVRENSIIKKVDVQVLIPQAGQAPFAEGCTTNTNGVYLTKVEWFKENATVAMTPNEKFVAGQRYACEVHVIVAGNSYRFDANAEVHYNASVKGDVITRDPEAKYMVARSVPIMATTPTTTTLPSTITVTTSPPVAGQTTKEASITSISTNHVRSSISWNLVAQGNVGSPTPLTDADTFLPGRAYYCIVTIKPDEGYAFPDDVTAYLNGGQVPARVMEGSKFLNVYSDYIELPNETNALAPTITVQPVDMKVQVGRLAVLSLRASIEDEGTLSYQWCSNTQKQNNNGTALGSASPNATFKADTQSVGVTYYYCIVTNTNSAATGSKTMMTTSNVVAVEVVNPSGILQSIVAPDDVTGLPNGTEKNIKGLNLPAKLLVLTDQGQAEATVTWSVGSSSYNPAKKEAQTVIVQGVVTLPTGITNDNNVPLSVQISVTVLSIDGTAPTKDYTVRYDANGGTGTPPTEAKVSSGGSYSIVTNMFSREGHVFSGWRTSPAGGVFYAPVTTFSVVGDTTLYAQWTAIPVVTTEDKTSLPPSDDPLVLAPEDKSEDLPIAELARSTTIEFTIDSKVVLKNGVALPQLDVPAMVIGGRTMIPFRYFIETALGGTANFDAATYTITANVMGHTFVMVIDELTISVDGTAVEMTQAPTIVDNRTLVPLRLIDTIAKSVGWDPVARKATIVL